MAAKKSFLLRISPELYEELERMASAELRSVNSQIEYLLRDAVSKRRRATLPAPPPSEGAPELGDPEDVKG